MTTRVAASVGFDDVQRLVNDLQSGDVGVIPPGTAAWQKQLNWGAPPNVRLQGSGIDQTIIIDNYKPSTDKYHTAGPLIAISPAEPEKFTMAGFTVKADAANSNYKQALIEIYGQNKKWRATAMEIDQTNGVYVDFSYAVVTGFQFWGHINGVIDHCTFKFPDRGGAFIVNYNQYAGKGTEGDEAWAADPGFGGSDFIFFEDCKIINPGSGGVVNDAYRAGSFVIRYNEIQGAGLAQTHPTGGSHRARGARKWEVYKNRAILGGDGKSNFNAFFCSSGSGVFWGNDMPGTHSNMITLHSMRFDTKTYTQAPVPDGWGQYPSNYDVVGDPLDQPGMGQCDLLTGGFPNVKNAATGCPATEACVQPHQKREGVYEWDNNWVNPNMGGQKLAPYEPVMKEGVHFFRDTPMPGYTPYVYPHPLNVPEGPPAPPIDPPVDPPIDPPVDPPVEPPNVAPSIALLQVRNATGAILDPAVPITLKNVTIATATSDDSGVTYLQIAVKLASNPTWQVLKSDDPKANPTTMTTPWNTSPFKGKGPVLIEVTARDAEGLETKKALTVTVKK